MKRRALDTNVLVQAHVAAAPRHAQVRLWLESQLADPDVSLIVTPLVVHEFVHVVTDPRRFDPPVPMTEAVAIARLYLTHDNVECLPADGGALALTLDLLERHGLGRKRIADTLFAAILIVNGVSELATSNPDDFAVFGALRLLDPAAEPG